MPVPAFEFTVQIRADNGTWFAAHNGENLPPLAADRMIAELRAQGFAARAILSTATE
jgi:hypothetical protein